MPRSSRGPRSVLIIGSEAVPFAKTGGLADVLGALPLALARLGWDVTLVLPRYRGVTGGSLAERFPLTVGGYATEVGMYEVPLGERVRAMLVDVPDLFNRAEIYGAVNADYPDSPRRFAVLVRAAFELAARRKARPSVVHAHDWQAGLAPVYLKTIYAAHPVLRGTPSVLTIHNLAYQGLFEPDWLPRLDLPWDLLTMNRLEFWGKMSFLKGGITDAGFVTTVSPTYAKEIQTEEFGCGFDGILRHRSAHLIGILNGIDTTAWNPAEDKNLPAPFGRDDLDGRRVSKLEVLKRYGMPVDQSMLDRPLIGMISRMVDQKGFDLVAAIAPEMMALDASWVVLGTGEARYQDLWRNLAAEHPDRVGARIGFDEALAHLIEAGADMFLMPSRFEPCGLNQLYSLRYGTVPIVRAVGGLSDTVRDGKTGFVFREYAPEALLRALERALTTFRNRRQWRAIQSAGMKEDHSWDRSAREYVKIYERVIRDATDFTM